MVTSSKAQTLLQNEGIKRYKKVSINYLFCAIYRHMEIFLKWVFARECSIIGKVRFCQNTIKPLLNMRQCILGENSLKKKYIGTPRTLIPLMSWFPSVIPWTFSTLEVRWTVSIYKYINKKIEVQDNWSSLWFRVTLSKNLSMRKEEEPWTLTVFDHIKKKNISIFKIMSFRN